MKPLYLAYTTMASGLFFTGFPAFFFYTRLSGRYGKGLKERLGFIPHRISRRLSDRPRIWLHAASLGEVNVASPIIKSLKQLVPDCSLVLSTTTEHGQDLANEMIGDVAVFYAPIDLTFSVRKALSGVRPDVMVFLETEIWPSWLFEAHRSGIRTALINGRVSNRSIRRYLRFRPFFVDVLKNFDVFSMIGTVDARRISEMGADLKKIEINGNAKYELLADQADPALEADMRRVLNLEPSHPVFVAGSTRDGEETMILDVYEKILKQFPDAILVIAPRHVVRTPAIESLLRTRGFRYQLLSELKGGTATRAERVVIMNTFGELFKLYSVGTINFCGASLVPLGGQNPMEAAVWGKAVFYGPSMEDFLDAKVLLEREDAGIQVEDTESFGEKALWFLNHPDELRERGNRAGKAALMNLGAAEKHAGVITRLL